MLKGYNILARPNLLTRARRSSVQLLLMTALLLALAVGLTAIPAAESTVSAQGGVAQFAPTGETDLLHSSDNPGADVAVWLHPTDPSQSAIIGADKRSGLAVFNLDGDELHYMEGAEIKNVDLRYNFYFDGEFGDIVVGGNRTNDTLAIFRMNPDTRELEDVAADDFYVGVLRPDSLCMYHSPVSSKHYVFVGDHHGEWEQWELSGDGAGLVNATLVRTFDLGSKTTGCAADDTNAVLYIPQEGVGIWKLGAEPGDSATPTQVDAVGGASGLGDTIEGLAIYYKSDGTGYLLANNQNSSSFIVYDRVGDNSYLGTFQLVDGVTVDGVVESEGLDVTNFSLNPNFPSGMFVAMDSENDGDDDYQNYKMVPWGDIAAPLGLDTDTTYDPRLVGFNAAPTAESQVLGTEAGSSLDITLVGADADTPLGQLGYIIVDGPDHGVLNGAGANWTYTPELNYNGPDGFSFVVSDGYSNSDLATVDLTVHPETLLYLTLANDYFGFNGVTITNDDVAMWDGTNFRMLFDGSDVGIESMGIDALIRLSPSELVLSFAKNGDVPGLGWVEDIDMVKFNATSLGENTAGSFEWYFQGRDVAITSNDEDIDGAELLPDGRLLISTRSWYVVPGPVGELTGGGKELLAFTPTSLGEVTAGTWELYFNGNDVELTDSDEEVIGTAVDSLGRIYLSTAGSFEVTPLFGNRDDIFVFNPTSLGSPTAGTYDPDRFFDGSAAGVPSNSVSAFDLPDSKLPTALSQSVNVEVNQSADITLTATDEDTPDEILLFEVVTQPGQGTLSGSAPNLTYTPNLDYLGPDSFTFLANDGSNDSNTATVYITVHPHNEPPVADNQGVATVEDTSVDITLTGSDLETPEALVYTVLTQPSHGLLTGTAPDLTYTPGLDYSGPDIFTFQVNDGLLDSNVATVNISVVGETIMYLSVDHEGSLGNNGLNMDGADILAFDGTDLSKHFDGSDAGVGHLKIDGFHVLSDTEILMSFTNDGFVPGIAPEVEDTDIVKFTATSLGENTAGSFEVFFVGRDASLSNNDEDISGLHLLPDGRLLVTTRRDFFVNDTEPQPLTGSSHDIIAYDFDTALWSMYFDGSDVGLDDGSAELLSALAVDAAGTVYLSTGGSFSVPGAEGHRDDVFVFNPTSLGPDTAGTYSPTLALEGSAAGLGNNTIYGISLPMAAAAPTAHDQSVNTDEDTAVGITLDASDPDTPLPSLIYTILTQPANGALSGTAPDLTYTPDPDYTGPDSFTWQASDDEFDSNIATVSINVGDVNDPPTAESQSVNTQEDTPVDVTLAAVDGDTPPEDLVYSIVDGPAHGSLSGTAPDLTYTPDSEYNGPDSFTWQVNDGDSDSNVATVSVNIGADNMLYFTLYDAGTLGANNELSVGSEDIVAFDGTTMSLFFDGSDLGFDGYRIDAVEVLNGSEILMSFNKDRVIPGIPGEVEDTDVVKFTATSLGENTSGTFELFFHGRDVGLASNDDDVMGIDLLDDGRFLVSTRGNFTALGDEGGLNGTGHDIIALNDPVFGPVTSGSWSLYFQGGDVGLSSSSEIVPGFSVDASGKIYLTTGGGFSVPGLSGEREDIFVFNPTTLGDETTGTYDAELFLDGSLYHMSGDNIIALDVPAVP